MNPITPGGSAPRTMALLRSWAAWPRSLFLGVCRTLLIEFRTKLPQETRFCLEQLVGHGVKPLTNAKPDRLLAALLAAALLPGGCTTPRPTELRGAIDHTSAESVRQQADFDVTLAPARDGSVCLRFTRIEITTSRVTRFYEKYIEYKIPGETDPSKNRKELLPGEYIPVPGEEKTESRVLGPLAAATLDIAGTSVTTDAGGVVCDTGEMILGQFDRQKLADNAEVTLRISHAELGEKRLTITRKKLLEALGIPQDVQGATSDEGLRAQVRLDPVAPHAGDRVRVTLLVENQGLKPMAKVIGRTFSRHAWLNGRNFYLGTVLPQSKRAFVRTVSVPATLPASDAAVFATLGIWNLNTGDQLAAERPVAVPFTIPISVASPVQR